ncbi:CoA transferase [Novosphingobium sp. Chol11]|uniref:CaiB/BaiF CoA-transferase family protein n=1 Tax=Novosphingobium sp. Chol11 TaxID=1385763 RepID=UPI0025E999B6|nr:CoA transferase [Novosphingobium sp. Chol11]
MNTGQGGAPLWVLEVSSGIAGAYCGWLLGDMGAEVLTLAGPAPEENADPLALAIAYYAKAKRKVSPEAMAAALAGADLIITDDPARLEALAGATLADMAARQPATVFGVTTVFGLTGPLATVPAVPLDAQAVASVSWALGEPGRPPLSIPPGVLDCQAGAHLAAACLMARRAGPGLDGTGRIVDIALADVLAHYVGVNCRFYIHHGMTWRREGRRAADSGGAYPFVILPCADGAVCLSGRTRPEWERFVEAMGRPAWSQEPRYQKLRAMGQQYPEEVDALVMPWLATQTKAEIEAIADRFKLTIAPLRDLAEVLATPQLAHRDFLREWTFENHTLIGPGLPFRASAARGDAQGADLAPQMLSRAAPSRPAGGTQPLAGLRVLDLGWVWSAPQVGSMLAQLGAEVIKVEHRARPDNARMSGVIIRDGQRIEGQTMDMSPMFHQINKGKLGITLNLKQPEGVAVLKQLAATSDIVLENMSAGSVERSGIGYDTLRSDNPGLVMLAMSGAGQFGPASDMRTYAPTMSSFVGLESMVGYPSELPTGALNFAIGDPNAAVHALVALFAALERREASGEGCYIDLSQTEALFATLTPYALQAQIAGHQPTPMGNRHPAMAPHGIYPAAGADRWLTLAVRDDKDWTALGALAAGEGWAGAQTYANAAGRIAARDALDAALAGWTAGQDCDELVAALRAAGIPASPVNDIDGLWQDPQIAARAMADLVEIPGLGAEILFRSPWTVSGVEIATGTRGPVIGEHNVAVLQGLLGLSEEAYAKMNAAGVLS